MRHYLVAQAVCLTIFNLFPTQNTFSETGGSFSSCVFSCTSFYRAAPRFRVSRVPCFSRRSLSPLALSHPPPPSAPWPSYPFSRSSRGRSLRVATCRGASACRGRPARGRARAPWPPAWARRGGGGVGRGACRGSLGRLPAAGSLGFLAAEKEAAVLGRKGGRRAGSQRAAETAPGLR